MPAPEENVAACCEYLLRANPVCIAMRFAIGAEDAVYLMGQMPLLAIDVDRAWTASSARPTPTPSSTSGGHEHRLRLAFRRSGEPAPPR